MVDGFKGTQRENAAANMVGGNDVDDDTTMDSASPLHRVRVMKLSRPKLSSRSTFMTLMNLIHANWRAFCLLNSAQRDPKK